LHSFHQSGFRQYGGVVGIALRPERVPFCREFKGMLMGGNVVIRRTVLQSLLPYPEHLGKIGPEDPK